MPVEIGGQVFAQRHDDVLLRCDCGGKTIREVRVADGTIPKTYRRCAACGIVYFTLNTSAGGLIVAGVDVMTRPDVRVYR